MAVTFLASGARRLGSKLPQGIMESKLLTWVLTGDNPDYSYIKIDPDNYIERKNIEDTLEFITDREVKKYVLLSYKKSIKAQHLVYRYPDNMLDHDKSRVRILTRMLWYSN